jgi:hypothetical protein
VRETGVGGLSGLSDRLRESSLWELLWLDFGVLSFLEGLVECACGNWTREFCEQSARGDDRLVRLLRALRVSSALAFALADV